MRAVKDKLKTDVLHTSGFVHAVPVSIDLIEPNLYLGNLTSATDLNTLTKYKITHVLTIDTCPLPRNILRNQHIKFKFIQLSDLPREDLLSYFADANAFISEGCDNGAVLVHCYFGVSRSATLVLAYVMRKYNLSFHQAFEKVRRKRAIIFPNHGFISQLKLYKEMQFKIDKNHMKYKMFRLGVAADKVRKVKILPQDFLDLIKPDPDIVCAKPEPNVYRCKKCRRILASESNLLTHSDKTTHAMCRKIYFVEPIAWMENVANSTQGKLHCPKCQSKLGSFSWIMGCQCPCGSQVAPAFYLTPSKVDWTNVVQNVVKNV